VRGRAKTVGEEGLLFWRQEAKTFGRCRGFIWKGKPKEQKVFGFFFKKELLP
jgi:hypothetical protein